MEAGLRDSIREYQAWLRFRLRRDAVRLEADLPHDESLSLGVCHRFYGKEKELPEAIGRGNGILKGLLPEQEKSKGRTGEREINGRYLALFYGLVGNLYYFKGDFRLAAGYFMRVLDYEWEDLTAWVELLFCLRAIGEFTLFEDGMFGLERIYTEWRGRKEKEGKASLDQETLVRLITPKVDL
jgi:hypothetical protein